MPNSQPRPKAGLRPEQAFERWCDKATYQALVELSGQSPPPCRVTSHRSIHDNDRLRKYDKLREEADEAFTQLLIDGLVGASGIPVAGTGREAIGRSLWELLEIDYDFGEVNGEEFKYRRVEFYDPSEIPQNVDVPSSRLEDDQPISKDIAPLEHDSSYQLVTVKVTFNLSPLRARVVKLLHEASLTDDPWQNGKVLLGKAGSEQTKLGDVFKSLANWKLLIESDDAGRYRLRR